MENSLHFNGYLLLLEYYLIWSVSRVEMIYNSKLRRVKFETEKKGSLLPVEKYRHPMNNIPPTPLLHFLRPQVSWGWWLSAISRSVSSAATTPTTISTTLRPSQWQATKTTRFVSSAKAKRPLLQLQSTWVSLYWKPLRRGLKPSVKTRWTIFTWTDSVSTFRNDLLIFNCRFCIVCLFICFVL